MISPKNCSVLNRTIEYEDIVQVNDAFKSYGSKNDCIDILSGLNMTIKRNSIYALIGASGVGKTTLIKCLIGIDTLQSGTIKMFGDADYFEEKLIGYMPQEVALVQKFTAREMIHFFGMLYGVSRKNLKYRTEFICQLLELPDNKLILNCSGGEQRRISFASALIHEPKLLILDEPTVGVDPILRDRIWLFLKHMVVSSDTTVIISTQYVQEALNATRLGFLRHGILLVEDCPRNVIKNLNVNDLDEAYVKLSISQKKKEKEAVWIRNCDRKQIAPHRELTSKFSFNRVLALMTKNFIHQRRSFTIFLFACLMPLMLIYCMSLFGKYPKDLKLGIVSSQELNFDHQNCSISLGYSSRDAEEQDCNIPSIVCRFIEDLKVKFDVQNCHQSQDEARQKVLRGKSIGYILIGENFTNYIQNRLKFTKYRQRLTVSDAINVFIDESNYQLARYTENAINAAYEDSIDKTMKGCHKTNTEKTPLEIEAIYGKLTDEYGKILSIGGVLTCFFFLASSLSASAFIEDKAEGVLYRLYVAGTNASEIIFSHLMSSMTVICIHFIQFYGFLLYQFSDESSTNMNHCLVCLLLLVTGVTGLIYGLFISTVTKSHAIANICTTTIFLPILAVTGILWPHDGVIIYLRYPSYILPFTVPTVAMTGMIYRGYTLKHPTVSAAFSVLILWTTVTLLLCFKILNKRK